MWSITDADSEIFILAAIHVLPAGTKWRSPAVNRAMDAAEAVWFEADDESADAQAKAREIFAGDGTNADSVKLTSMLSTADAMSLVVIANDLAAPAGAFDAMRPWAVFLTLSVQAVVKEGYDPGAGLSREILTEAHARGREIGYFNTIDDQLRAFTTMTPAEELEAASYIIENWGAERAKLPGAVEAWRTGDIAALESLVNAPLREGAPAVFQKVVLDQTGPLADKIEGLLDGKGTVLAVIGASYLVGEGSILEQLENRGVTVERVSN
ncbi:MAG: TraB/GumN family protein [Parvularculaceae bacterium]